MPILDASALDRDASGTATLREILDHGRKGRRIEPDRFAFVPRLPRRSTASIADDERLAALPRDFSAAAKTPQLVSACE